MTKDEYRTALREIISDGRGFDAIRDLTIAIYKANMQAIMNGEQKTISDASNKEKV